MQFFVNVLGAAIVIVLMTAAEWSAHRLAGGMNGAVVIATLIFVGMNRLVWARPISEERVPGWDYLTTSVGFLAIIAAAFHIVEDQARTRALLITPAAFIAVERYVSTWCYDPNKRNDTTRVTCALASDIEELLLKSEASSDTLATERPAAQFLKRIISSKELNGKIEVAGQYDLDAFVPKPGLPPELAQFGVVANYVAILNDNLLDVDRQYQLPWGTEWVRGVVNSNSELFLWLLFNAALIKLALTLSKARGKWTGNIW